MTVSADRYACVVMVNGFYAAALVEGKRTKIISDVPFEVNQVAQLAAEKFAHEYKIFYASDVKSLARPVVSVIKHRSQWYPIKIDSNSIHLLDRVVYTCDAELLKGDPKTSGAEKTEALRFGEKIAMLNGWDFSPRIAEQMIYCPENWRAAL